MTSLYDNGTVTQQASINQTMASKAKRLDEIEDKGRMKSAYDEGSAEAEQVIQGLASKVGIMESQLNISSQSPAGSLADYAVEQI